MVNCSNTPLTQPASTSAPDLLEPVNPTKQLIPDYLLCDILVHLDTFTLLTCRLVCHFWKWSTESRARLRRLLFTQPPLQSPLDGQSNPINYNLHPVLRLLDYHLHVQMYFRDPSSPIKPLAERLDFRMNDLVPAASPVVNNFATAPAVREIVVKMCGVEMSVRRKEGVRVWDLMVCFDTLYASFSLS